VDSIIGKGVGLFDGTNVGTWDGKTDGIPVWTIVGSKDINTDGFLDGIKDDGIMDGKLVGYFVGIYVGNDVKLLDGIIVGDADGIKLYSLT
jgi:hypothetical protein